MTRKSCWTCSKLCLLAQTSKRLYLVANASPSLLTQVPNHTVLTHQHIYCVCCTGMSLWCCMVVADGRCTSKPVSRVYRCCSSLMYMLSHTRACFNWGNILWFGTLHAVLMSEDYLQRCQGTSKQKQIFAHKHCPCLPYWCCCQMQHPSLAQPPLLRGELQTHGSGLSLHCSLQPLFCKVLLMAR